jgi:hypothetical protein
MTFMNLQIPGEGSGGILGTLRRTLMQGLFAQRASPNRQKQESQLSATVVQTLQLRGENWSTSANNRENVTEF